MTPISHLAVPLTLPNCSHSAACAHWAPRCVTC